MTIQIGPISLPFVERLSFGNRRRVTLTPIPMGRSVGYTAGVELARYQLNSVFHASTDAAAKTLRRQLNELVNNPHIDFVYITFGVDSDEHSGWYILEDISTDVPPAVFGAYPVSLNVVKIGNPGSHLLGTYWTNSDRTNDWSFTGNAVVTLPNGSTSTFLKVREASSGENRYLEDFGRNLISYPLPTVSGLYDARCRIIDTTTAGSTDTSEWVEVYGAGHVWAGDAIFGNDLIRFRWYSSSGETAVEVYDTGAAAWVEVIDDYVIVAGGGAYSAGTPIITRFDWERVEWQIVYSTRLDTTLIIDFTLTRGTYFISVKISTNNEGLDPETRLTAPGAVTISQVEHTGGSASPTVGLAVDPNSNYAAARLSSGHYIGFLYTEQGAGQPSAGADNQQIRQSVTVAANATYYGAIFATEYPLTGTLNLGNLGLEYLANVRQQLVLADPVSVAALSEVNAVDNILLETGTDNLLLESGDLLLIE